MGYFDDLTILSVRRVTTSVAKTPEASPFMGSLGVMEGKSVIRLIGSRKKQFRPPLVYWSVPGTRGRFFHRSQTGRKNFQRPFSSWDSARLQIWQCRQSSSCGGV